MVKLATDGPHAGDRPRFHPAAGNPADLSLGARGIGEIGLTGIAAAITDAVHHATGVRVRELPVKIEDLLKSTV